MWLVHLEFRKGNGLQIQISSKGDRRDRSALLLRGDEVAGTNEMRPLVLDALIFKGGHWAND